MNAIKSADPVFRCPAEVLEAVAEVEVRVAVGVVVAVAGLGDAGIVLFELVGLADASAGVAMTSPALWHRSN